MEYVAESLFDTPGGMRQRALESDSQVVKEHGVLPILSRARSCGFPPKLEPKNVMSLFPAVGCKAGAMAVRIGFANPKAFCKLPDNRGSVAISTARPGRMPGGWTKETALSDVHAKDGVQSVPPSPTCIWEGVADSAEPK